MNLYKKLKKMYRAKQTEEILYACDVLGLLAAKQNILRRAKLKNIDINDYREPKRVVQENMGEYNRRGMHIYGANVQLARAIPNVMDGFKPVARRTLYAMAKISHADKKLKKALNIKGDVIKIHPHGDASIDDMIASLGKDWEMTYPLVDVDGNYGGSSGDNAAAARYLDVKLSDYCIDCYFKDWDSKLIEMNPTYNQDEVEPEYLVSKFPDILLRPVTGFTFGQATAIPSYNLEESFNAMISLIKDPDYDPILIPDMPSGCIIMDEGQFPAISHKGIGSFRMRANIEIIEERSMLVVTSLPYQVKLSDVISKLATLRGDVLPQFKLFDASDEEGVCLQLTFQPGTDLDVMKAILYKKTSLESVFGTQMRFVDMQRGKTDIYPLKRLMAHWLDNRRNIKRKWFINKFVNGKERLNILSVLILICEDKKLCDKIINLIRKSERDAVVELIHEKFPNISTTQALGIANMRIAGLSKTALSEYKDEMKELKSNLKEWDALIHSPKKIDKIIISELEAGIKKYHKPRRSRIEKYHAKKEARAMISDKDFILIFTTHSYIKKIPCDATSIGELMPGDEPIQTININNRESIILFDKQGFVHCLNVSDIPETSIKSKGLNLSQYISINGEIVAIIPKKKLTTKSHFIFITKNGFIKKTDCENYAFKSSVRGIILKGNDELVSVIPGTSSNNIIVYTKYGMGIRFDTSDFTSTSRAAAGVIALNLDKKDYVVGMTIVSDSDTHIMVMTEKGFGKISPLDSFATSKRRGEVVIITSLTKGDHVSVVKACNDLNRFIFVLKERIDEIPFDEFIELSRQHKGKKMVNVRKGETIIRCFKE